MGVEFFTDISIKILDLVTEYKPNVRLVCFLRDRKQPYRKYYIRMFEENMILVFNLLITLEELVLVEKLSSSTLITIIKRSYSLKDDIVFLGRGSIKIGNICIKILASNLVENGEEALRNLNNETRYKNLKKKITKALGE